MNSNDAGGRGRLKGRFNFRAAHGLLLGLLVIAIIAGVRLRERLVEPAVVPPPPLLVESVRAIPAPLVVTASYSGSVEARRRATLSARLGSTVVERLVGEGESVVAGQLLLRLDATEPRQELARLQAAAQRVRADLNYWEGQLKADRQLFAKGTISEQRLQQTMLQADTLRAALEENRHALATAETRLGYAEVVAPFAGVVQALLVEEGETVNPGSALLELVDPTTLKAVVSAPQVDRQRLAPGLQVYLDLHHLATFRLGEIARIYPALESRSRNLTFEVALHEEESPAATPLQPGMSVAAVVELERIEAAISVPLHAVRQRQGR
ncbi:MAG: efflux RND transporter periplasmic adaptor subunit, partial [Gammaproteobacteria bacterium]|nr:efflux RND transporter periplasmic adaptor subunit [Gammaproteobacteria bacterium]